MTLKQTMKGITVVAAIVAVAVTCHPLPVPACKAVSITTLECQRDFFR